MVVASANLRRTVTRNTPHAIHGGPHVERDLIEGAEVSSTWTPEAIDARIQELDDDLGWYQDIDLLNGRSTKTRRVWGEEIDHPKKRWTEMASVVPDDMTGMSVLDIGCNAGYFSFQAKDRGAAEVLGVDLKQGYIDQARFCAEVRNQDVEFQQCDIYDLTKLGRTFDFVFCIGILYHCNYLKKAVEQVGAVCKGTAAIETAIHPGHNELPLVRFVRTSQYGGPDATGAARLPGHWHPNMTALKDLFYECGFATVEDVFVDGGRGGVVARR